MDGNEMQNVPYVVYESAQSRMERINKKLIIALILTIVLMFLSNALWLYAWTRFDSMVTTETTTSSVDLDATDGDANYIGNDGDIVNGTYKSGNDNNQNNEDEETQNLEQFGK